MMYKKDGQQKQSPKKSLLKTGKELELFLTIPETCEYLAVSRQTLNRWERQRLLIPCRIGTQVRYSINDIINTLNSSRYARA